MAEYIRLETTYAADSALENGLRVECFVCPTAEINDAEYIRADIHEELRQEVTNLAQESVARSLELARLEAEVMRLRKMVTPRPIEEAPKDGTWFFVLHRVQVTGRRYPAWIVCQWYAEQRPGRSSQYDGWHDDAGLPINPGPFWLPMPPAPEVSK